MARELRSTVEAARSRCLAISRIDERMRFLARCPLAQTELGLDGIDSALREESVREATTNGEWSVCGLSKARPISCSVSPAFHRLHMSLFLNRSTVQIAFLASYKHHL